jgi:hypothetical protein
MACRVSNQDIDIEDDKIRDSSATKFPWFGQADGEV